MKISQKTVQYILLLLIVIIAACAYQFGYVKYIDKANAVKTENKAIEARIAELEEKETHREDWTATIDKTDDEIAQLLSKYGPGNTPEKSIMFITSLEKAAGMDIPSLSFNSDTPVFVSDDTDEDGNPKVVLNSTYVALSYRTTYDGLKACMDYINNYPERMNVNGFTANYDQESGQLNGNMVINLFSVTDKDHRYYEPAIGGIEIGTDNIFGTADLSETVLPVVNEPVSEPGETGEGEEGGE